LVLSRRLGAAARDELETSPDLSWWLGSEGHAQFGKPVVFALDVVDGEDDLIWAL
jgi:hypothetical protein